MSMPMLLDLNLQPCQISWLVGPMPPSMMPSPSPAMAVAPLSTKLVLGGCFQREIIGMKGEAEFSFWSKNFGVGIAILVMN
ncbi:uncharacterized protein A4U43_C04F11810 [Asparagus officinalis]|uniref:Uncharacterized protein n=1 Tax=Asparagus officinalis TaxID=4686 RepID=A0A5P1F0U5_ASPOF|nr:uncharacterized protein A4U43_C04F11810 [Asparagus officinalis]